MKYKLCILAAGQGSRLGFLTSRVNKALLPIDNKAAISHIIEKVTPDVEIVIPVGFAKESVKEYCLLAHPEYTFTFVDVEDWDKTSSKGINPGPGTSLAACKEHLQCPFYIFTNDCLVTNELPGIPHNWLGLAPTNDPSSFATCKVHRNTIKSIKNKEKSGYPYAFIGLAGIEDYETFWKETNITIGNFNDGELVTILGRLISEYGEQNFQAYFFDWYDTGTQENYADSAKKLAKGSPLSIPKTSNEFTYKIGNRYIKYLSDKTKLKTIVERNKALEPYTPNIDKIGDNFFSYKWIEGSELYDLKWTDELSEEFYEFLQDFWIDLDIPGFRYHTLSFYRDKTIARVKSLLEKYPDDITEVIYEYSSTKVKPLLDYVEKIDWEVFVNKAIPSTFHGDLHFANTIYGNNQFKFIDLREDFGGCLLGGDRYYDLAKLYGGLELDYSKTKIEENMNFRFNDGVLYLPVLSTSETRKMKSFLDKKIEAQYDLYHIELITALIYLNMAPLHEHNFSKMLVGLAKFKLDRIFH